MNYKPTKPHCQNISNLCLRTSRQRHAFGQYLKILFKGPLTIYTRYNSLHYQTILVNVGTMFQTISEYLGIDTLHSKDDTRVTILRYINYTFLV